MKVIRWKFEARNQRGLINCRLNVIRDKVEV